MANELAAPFVRHGMAFHHGILIVEDPAQLNTALLGLVTRKMFPSRVGHFYAVQFSPPST